MSNWRLDGGSMQSTRSTLACSGELIRGPGVGRNQLLITASRPSRPKERLQHRQVRRTGVCSICSADALLHE